jgi:hypothetical protein
MITREDVAFLTAKTPQERREIIALAAGLNASDAGDGGRLMATALRRIADRLDRLPREAAA